MLVKPGVTSCVPWDEGKHTHHAQKHLNVPPCRSCSSGLIWFDFDCLNHFVGWDGEVVVTGKDITLAINSRNEDLPTPDSPRRRKVCDAFALLFDSSIIPFLRGSTLLEKSCQA